MAKSGKRHTGKIVGAIILAVFIIAITLFGNYVSDFYQADEAAFEALSIDDADGVKVQELDDGSIVFIPEDAKVGLIFYPGGKVQSEAYAPLMRACAQRGILCVLTQPLYNLAILDVNMADEIPIELPAVSTWIIGGHSLGGVAASMYAAKHLDEFGGIVFLAAYPSKDLSGFSGSSLSIYGTNDGVLDLSKYEKADAKLPEDAREFVIEGGNHASFGDYGEQKGDGEATISHEDQQAQTADAIAELAKAA